MISDASIEEIAKLPKLRKLIAGSSHVTHQGVAKLKGKVSECVVEGVAMPVPVPNSIEPPVERTPVKP